MKKLDLEGFQIRLNQIHPNEDLIALEWNGDREISKVKCNKCGIVYEKNGGNFLDKRKKSICKNCFPTNPNKLKEDWIPPKNYEAVETYKGMHNKIAIRHKECGFIWKITPSNLKMGKGCPKCNKVKSKGEQAIEKFLQNNNIKYIWQFPVEFENHKLKVDFYLPELDKYIEYNGEQHYKPVEHFGGEEKFKQQQFNDNLKKKYLKNKLLIISYLEFDNINSILKSSTTIPNGSR